MNNLIRSLLIVLAISGATAYHLIELDHGVNAAQQLQQEAN